MNVDRRRIREDSTEHIDYSSSKYSSTDHWAKLELDEGEWDPKVWYPRLRLCAFLSNQFCVHYKYIYFLTVRGHPPPGTQLKTALRPEEPGLVSVPYKWPKQYWSSAYCKPGFPSAWG